MEIKSYEPQHPIRFVTAASLFDGHDAAINIIRRMLQSSGAEVIHLGHNRSVQEVVDTAIEEDVQGVAISSYQGGHMEYFKYLHDLLRERGAGHVRVFGGGGGVIVLEEIKELEAYGIDKIFSPEDGMRIGLQGMINYMLEKCDFTTLQNPEGIRITELSDPDAELARALTCVELQQNRVSVGVSHEVVRNDRFAARSPDVALAPVVGVTGTGGAGKSTLTDELVRRSLNDFSDLRIAILSVDPTRRRTGGALLGDRIRMNAIYGAHAERVYMRSFATRQAHRSTSHALGNSIALCRDAGFDLIFLETAGIGQSDTEVIDLADISLYVMTAEFGAPTQLEKIGMLDLADLVALNKFEKQGSQDALRDIRKQVQRNRGLWHSSPEEMPVFPTMASHFNDPGVTDLYLALIDLLNSDYQFGRTSNIYRQKQQGVLEVAHTGLVPAKRLRYLGEIVETCRKYRAHVNDQAACARQWGQAAGARRQLENWKREEDEQLGDRLREMAQHWWDQLDTHSKRILSDWEQLAEAYRGEIYTYTVRNREISVPLFSRTLSGIDIPRVALPDTEDPGDRLKFALLENLPGHFPFTAGVYPFKRAEEEPTRMFAGEGSPERTNRRFHLVSAGMPAKRLSTAFDSVTLYGHDPEMRPDIYGKVGNAGVSICTLDDMKKLYSGFNLCDPSTSVSMTINGPAPMILAMFLNTAIDQQVELYLRQEGRWEDACAAINRNLEGRVSYVPFGPSGSMQGLPEGHDGTGLGLLGTQGEELAAWGIIERDTCERIKEETFRSVRGTVQADILKEDQAQNTCIFSTEFALRMMGDIQQYFIDHHLRNYYSVSVSGYHIAEAGANPITQLAFTLANGFTYVEYYLSRGMKIDSFAPNLSFFFSNGMDAEYSVLGRVARRIWAVAMRDRYGANPRSQKLKYHIQTSGRSLHAKEIQFNDIRTTLQALMGIYDNCNSLHTNAFDEAITTPTEESVRRAMAIQLIINRELGIVRNENPLQGSFVMGTLTDLVEEAVLQELDRINDRGGVLGAMELMYQRGRIQEESILYERKKHSGELPIVGVNTFMAGNGEDTHQIATLMRSSEEEKQHQIAALKSFHHQNAEKSAPALKRLQEKARQGENLFEELMETVKVCSLGQITTALFEVGGRYRRNM